MGRNCDGKADVTSEQIKAKWSSGTRRKRRVVAQIMLTRLLMSIKRAQMSR